MIYQKKFPAQLESLYDMLEFIKIYVEKSLPSALTLSQLTVGAEEALVNVISYGYPSEKKGEIEIICENTPVQPGVKVIIKDQGIPFNPVENVPRKVSSPSAILSKAETTLGGYGIYIMVGLMDAVEYQRLKDGNVLTLIKYAEIN